MAPPSTRIGTTRTVATLLGQVVAWWGIDAGRVQDASRLALNDLHQIAHLLVEGGGRVVLADGRPEGLPPSPCPRPYVPVTSSSRFRGSRWRPALLEVRRRGPFLHVAGDGVHMKRNFWRRAAPVSVSLVGLPSMVASVVAANWVLLPGTAAHSAVKAPAPPSTSTATVRARVRFAGIVFLLHVRAVFGSFPTEGPSRFHPDGGDDKQPDFFQGEPLRASSVAVTPPHRLHALAEQAWQVAAVRPAERQLLAVVQDHDVVAVKQRLQFADAIDVDDGGTMDAPEAVRVETRSRLFIVSRSMCDLAPV